jgi:hypothetical protein
MSWSGYNDVVFKFAEGILSRTNKMAKSEKLEKLFGSAKEIML